MSQVPQDDEVTPIEDQYLADSDDQYSCYTMSMKLVGHPPLTEQHIQEDMKSCPKCEDVIPNSEYAKTVTKQTLVERTCGT